MPFQTSTNLYESSKWIVDPNGDTPYTTIQAAIDDAFLQAAATGLQTTVIVRPGQYNENLVFKDQVQLLASVASSSQFNGARISGSHTPPTSGDCRLTGFVFFDASIGTIFSSAVAGSTSIKLENCEFRMLGAAGTTFDLLNWTGDITLVNCRSTGSVVDNVINNTGGAPLRFLNCVLGTLTGNAIVTGNTEIRNTRIVSNFQFGSSAEVDIIGCPIQGTIAATATSAITITDSYFDTVALTPVSTTSSNPFILGNVTINTSANPAIAGTGTIEFGSVTYLNGKNVAATITQSFEPNVGRASPYVVGTSGNFSTVQAALDAANAAGGGSVYLQPGTYTEDLTLYQNIDLIGANGDGQSRLVTLNGEHVPPLSGRLSFANLYLISSGNSAIATAAVASPRFFINTCEFGSMNFVFDVPNGVSGLFGIYNCIGSGGGILNIGATGGTSEIYNSDVGSTSSTMTAANDLNIRNSTISCTTSMSQSSDLIGSHSTFFRPANFSNSSQGDFNNCFFDVPISAPIITTTSINSVILSDVSIESNNDPVIAGTGEVVFGNVAFLNQKNIASTITQTYAPTINRTTPYVVGSSGNFATVQAALDAANAAGGGVVYLQPGTYTEDLTLYEEVNIVGINGDAQSRAVTLIGEHTLPNIGGKITIEGIYATSVGNSFLVTVNSSVPSVYLRNCEFGSMNYIFDVPNSGSSFKGIYNCIGNGGGIINHVVSGGGSVEIYDCDIGVGASTFNSRESIDIRGSIISCSISLIQSSLCECFHCVFKSPITLSNTAQLNIRNSSFFLLFTAAITHNSTSAIRLFDVNIDSSVVGSVIDGTGEVVFGSVTYEDNNTIAGTITQTYGTKFQTGALTSAGVLQLVPTSTQSIVAGTGITAAMFAGITRVQGSGGAVIVTATPSIADGIDGQILIVQGDSDTNTLTLQDESSLVNSGLQLSGGSNMTLGKGDNLQLTYDAVDGEWYEISRSNN